MIFWDFNVYIIVDRGKGGVLTLVHEIWRYRNDGYHCYNYAGPSVKVLFFDCGYYAGPCVNVFFFGCLYYVSLNVRVLLFGCVGIM